MNGRPWTDDEIEILRVAADKRMTCAEMADLLPDYTASRIYSKLRTLGLRSKLMPRGSRHRKRALRYGPVADPRPGELERRKAAVRADRC